MNNSRTFFSVAALLCLGALFTASAHAQDSQVKWTVIDSPNAAPVSTVSDSSSSKSSPKPDVKADAKSGNRDAEIEKALSGAETREITPASTEVSRESIEMMFAPYRKQSKQDFLSHTEHNLSDVINRAQSVHTQARAAQEGIALAQRRVLLAARQLFPEMNYEYQDRNGSLSAAEYRSRSHKVSLRQPLFRGGILWNSFLQERKMLESARNNHQKVIDDLVSEISKVYFEYQRAKSVAEDQEKALQVIQPQVKISEEKFKESLISEIEHLNVQSLAGQIEFDRETAKQELEIANLDLQHYLGLNMTDDLKIKAGYDVNKLISGMPDEDLSVSKIESSLGAFNKGQPIPGLDKLIDMSYGNRAELKVQVAQLQAARYGEKVRWGAFVPKVDMLLEFGELGEAFKQFTHSPDFNHEFRLMVETEWNAGGNKVGYTYEDDQRAPSVTQFQSGAGTITHRNSFTAGLLNGLDSFVDVKQAEVDKLNKVVELEQAEKKVLEEVKRAFYDYQKALIQMKSTIKRVQWRLRLRNLAQHRLEQKEVEISEYLQSEIDLLKERQEFHTALKDYFTAKSNLNYAVGVREFLEWDSNGKA